MGEIEALQAIFPDELEIVNGAYPNISLKIALESEQVFSSPRFVLFLWRFSCFSKMMRR